MGVVTWIIQICIHLGGILSSRFFNIMTIIPDEETIHFQQNNIDSKKTKHELSTQFNGILCKWSQETFIEYTLCISWFFGGERISKMSNMTVACHDE